jgi:hypothetical protein
MFKLGINACPDKNDVWLKSLAYYLSNNLFIFIYQFIPFSWIISTLGCLAFIIYDYLKYKESSGLDTQNIFEESIGDTNAAIIIGLICSAIFLFLLGIGLFLLELFIMIFFELPYNMGLGVFINSHSHNYLLDIYLHPERSLFLLDILEHATTATIILRVVAIFFTIYCLIIPFTEETKIKDTKNPSKNIVFYRISVNFIMFSYGLFLLPITIIWMYPIVLIWLSIIPYPTYGLDSLLVVIYSIILAFIIISFVNFLRLFISEYKKKKRGILRDEIKEEILKEIQGSNAEQSNS